MPWRTSARRRPSRPPPVNSDSRPGIGRAARPAGPCGARPTPSSMSSPSATVSSSSAPSSVSRSTTSRASVPPRRTTRGRVREQRRQDLDLERVGPLPRRRVVVQLAAQPGQQDRRRPGGCTTPRRPGRRRVGRQVAVPPASHASAAFCRSWPARSTATGTISRAGRGLRVGVHPRERSGECRRSRSAARRSAGRETVGQEVHAQVNGVRVRRGGCVGGRDEPRSGLNDHGSSSNGTYPVPFELEPSSPGTGIVPSPGGGSGGGPCTGSRCCRRRRHRRSSGRGSPSRPERPAELVEVRRGAGRTAWPGCTSSSPTHRSAYVSVMPPTTTSGGVEPTMYESRIGPWRVSRTSSTSGSARPARAISSRWKAAAPTPRRTARRAVLVQPLEVQVHRVAADVRLAPRGAGVWPMITPARPAGRRPAPPLRGPRGGIRTRSTGC